MERFLITDKRVALVGARTGTLKNPTKCLWRWKPDLRSNFFNPPANLCAVTYITEISFTLTLSIQFHSLTQVYNPAQTRGHALLMVCTRDRNPLSCCRYEHFKNILVNYMYLYVVYREFFASENCGENYAWKVC